MTLTYFKRFQMELDLATWSSVEDESAVVLAPQYRFLAWDEEDLPRHAKVKFQTFELEIDAHVFPSLSEYDGCHRLMTQITNRDNFVPAATWLVEFQSDEAACPIAVGTIQVLHDLENRGAIQNIAVTPDHRHRGIGTALVKRALSNLKSLNIPRAMLEVTAQNNGALRLYERLGFQIIRTVYKPSTVATP
ncbi:MAG: GNAT family N-acetyltransferase [Planctomycetaceae bacterium]|nr:GNAT family N-acetyltransferase [Planctomycetaceae bacterium]MBT5597514.1 GNAT family N-acetyltransferase [Planctomycetaceae bacterium]MBT6848729.1 GNAT family N-acetyltransferase [Planctomycetaceae bacterium]